MFNSVRFLEEIEDSKKTFQIWPLASAQILANQIFVNQRKEQIMEPLFFIALGTKIFQPSKKTANPIYFNSDMIPPKKYLLSI